MEEELRESACNGDIDTLRRLLTQGANVNAQHAINNWTALHWAAKRGHATIVRQLITHGADVTLLSNKGQTAAQVASDPQIVELLGGDVSDSSAPADTEKSSTSFVPNYLANPPFPYSKPQPTSTQQGAHNGETQVEDRVKSRDVLAQGDVPPRDHLATNTCSSCDELVLKARVANATETDFYEVELSRDTMTYAHLHALLCRELGVHPQLVAKIRKLPDTVVRKDKDVQRLKDFCELELVLSNKYVSESSRNYKPSVTPRNEDIVY